MMVKPIEIKNLELQYPMIEFLNIVTFVKQTCNVAHTAATVGFTTVSPEKKLFI